jgi:hypothetical protein
MYEHWKLDEGIDEKHKNYTAYDPDYHDPDEEPEHYEDPDFDEVWNATDEDESQNQNFDRNLISRNPSKMVEDTSASSGNFDIDVHNKNQWEEVE